MTYSNISLLNLCIIIIAAIMYFVGFTLSLLDKERHKRKSKLLRNTALMITMISLFVSVILTAFRTGAI